MKENAFQMGLCYEIQKMFPGSYILKNDPNYMQGIPDLIILYKDKWAALECKRTRKAHRQPNQDFHVRNLNKMSYAAFIYPENKEEILHELQKTFRA